jgi:hypothetical protein
VSLAVVSSKQQPSIHKERDSTLLFRYVHREQPGIFWDIEKNRVAHRHPSSNGLDEHCRNVNHGIGTTVAGALAMPPHGHIGGSGFDRRSEGIEGALRDKIPMWTCVPGLVALDEST